MVDSTTDPTTIAERAADWLCPHGCPSKLGHDDGCPIGATFPSRTRTQSPGHEPADCPTCAAYSAERVRLIEADPVLTDDERRWELWHQQGIGEPCERPPRRSKPRASRQCEPVGAVEIAARLGVKRATVDQWRQRAIGFPEPRWRVGGRPAWNWDEVESWAARRATVKARRTA